ncbi:MAG: hypothetical protein IJN81_00045 [Clostridia bacterium]|nr:hypothetical protein [Clostridia bacterium]
MKKLTVVLAVVLVLCVAGAVLVTVWLNRSGKPVENATATQAPTTEITSESDTTESASEATTVQEESSKLDITYEPTTVFEVKAVKREFKGQQDRFKLYKQVLEATVNPEVADVFFYDITHDSLADMIVITPLYDEETGKDVGRIIQLFTITQENTVTEIFRDFGGIRSSGNGISCYVTERDGKDCLLIVKDELDGSVGKLSYSVFYVREDGSVIIRASGQYSQSEDMDYESEAAFNSYSEQAEAQVSAAHTVLFDYRRPDAVSSEIDSAFKDYLKN